MFCRFKESVFLSVAATLLASSPSALAGEKCVKNSVATVAHANQTGKDVVDTAVGAGSFKMLSAALKAAGLVDALKGQGPFTVFAPTDEAFEQLPAGTIETLLKPENKDKLVAVLTYHVVAGNVTAADVVKLKFAKTLEGSNAEISVAEGKVKVDDANVVKTDITCRNGVIHVIDKVLLPKKSQPDVVDTAVKAGSFQTLVAAVKAAGLVDTLKGKGPFTVFAPTDEAFAKLPTGTVETLLKPENKDELVAVLTYHVVAGKVLAADVVKLHSAETVLGQPVTIDATKGVKINGAGVVKADIECGNGVIHVIDSVLLPK